MLYNSGAVLGIDVGFSASKKTTCFCLLSWTAALARFECLVTTSLRTKRQQAIQQLCAGRQLAAVAIDGPLAHGFVHVAHYRAAEALLSRGALQKRGKPGQTSAPTGQQLHRHASELAALATALPDLAEATHLQPIHPRRIVEAFPNLFLAALIPEAELPPPRARCF